MTTSKLPCFKAYDIRGKVPSELNAELAVKIGRCFAAVYGLSKVVVGRDIRLSGESLCAGLVEGLRDMGTDVIDLGLCGTEEIYHATFSMEPDGVDGGVIVTASHNPADYNGMKFVVRGARPVTGESGLLQMEAMITGDRVPLAGKRRGALSSINNKQAYIDHLLTYIDIDSLQPMTVVTNAGNGCAGLVLDLLEQRVPMRFIKLHNDPDGTFPNGVPNPLLPENRAETAEAVRANNADFGIGWDGDFDRCFFWDGAGEFVEGYYIVGLLAEAMLAREPGSKILYDPRLTWATEQRVSQAGGVPLLSRTGHAFIKERMRLENALYGGEMSAHHYFRDFAYCDSGMIPWLLVAAELSRNGGTLAELVADRRAAFPVSGEINSTVEDADGVIAEISRTYSDGLMDYTDGLSVAYPNFRFNIRKSNTEPLLRLNVESRGDQQLMEKVRDDLLAIIRR